MQSIQHWLRQKQHAIGFVIFVSLAAFSTYACMYAFRKAFSVGIFENMTFFGLEYKSALIILQAIGYMLSKFLGIKFISEMSPQRRAKMLVVLIFIAEFALIGFAYVPAPYNVIFLFLNGLPLGMIWGIVFSYLEGRRTTEVLGAILSTTFIIASNVAKSVGQALILWGVSEFQMPYLVGLIFTIPLLISVWLLNQTPPPNKEDEHSRIKRVPMEAKNRWETFKSMAFGLILLILNYMFLTAYRDLRSNYASDIWRALGYESEPSLYVTTTIPMTLIVLGLLGFIFLIKNNLKALYFIQFIVLLGLVMVGVSTFAFEMGWISGVLWIIAIGTGTYLAYIPFNCFLFERTIAAFKIMGNVGFFIYLADSFGYLASVGILLYKNFFQSQVSWFHFIIQASYILSIVGTFTSILTLIYYWRKSLSIKQVSPKMNFAMQ